MAYGKIKADTLVWDNSGSDVETTVQSLTTPTPEGTVVKSTGESGGTKFLREDGDNTCSWQAVPIPTSITVADESSDTTCFPLFVTAATGDLAPKTGTNITFNASTGKLVIGGDLQVDGTTTTVNSSTMTVTDKNIEIAKGAANDAAADGAGITVDSGDGDKTWNWVDATDAWTSSEHIHVPDSKKFIAGTGSDLQIYNDGNSRVHNTNNGENLILQSDYITFRTNQVNENVFISVPNGEVQLFHNGIKTFETYSSGIIVQGTESGNGDIYLYADEGDDNADKWNLKALTDGTFTIGNKSTGSWVAGLTLNGSNNATFAGTVSDSKGDVRTIPQLSKSAQHTIVASDSGKHSINSSGGWIINTSTGFTAGQAVTLINNSGSDQTVTNTGCTMYLANDTTAKSSLTLKGRGMATFICTASNVYYGSGAGLE